MWHNHNCKHASAHICTHHVRGFSLLWKSILFDISMEMKWIRMNIMLVCVSQNIHKFSVQLNLLKRNMWFGNTTAIAGHHQMPNDYYYYYYVLCHILIFCNRWKCDGKTFACNLIFTNEFSYVVTFVCQCVKHPSHYVTYIYTHTHFHVFDISNEGAQCRLSSSSSSSLSLTNILNFPCHPSSFHLQNYHFCVCVISFSCRLYSDILMTKISNENCSFPSYRSRVLH